jgi:exosome complex RNA-binding protein Rrp42 (RNase PH superfamily)
MVVDNSIDETALISNNITVIINEDNSITTKMMVVTSVCTKKRKIINLHFRRRQYQSAGGKVR